MFGKEFQDKLVAERAKKSKVVVAIIRIPATPEEAEELAKSFAEEKLPEVMRRIYREWGMSVSVEDRISLSSENDLLDERSIG